MRLTEYHCGVAVIKNKELLGKAMDKLAVYEDLGYSPKDVESMIEALEMIITFIDRASSRFSKDVLIKKLIGLRNVAEVALLKEGD